VVLVHDAVRPFVKGREVQRLVQSVRTHGAASLALPVADTLREASEDVFGETVPRQDLYRMQTPQGFRRAWLEDAHHAAATADEQPATDDVGLVQRQGRTVRLVQGSRRNFKITTTGDWQMAQQLWAAWTQSADGSSSTS
jgi:2-C-methyl-D-erythritol 4-phosphate cytidylyltransferase